MAIKITKLKNNAIIPTKASNDIGYDLYACLDKTVNVFTGRSRDIPTGIKIEPPDGYFCAIFAKVGIATRFGLRPANCVGIYGNEDEEIVVSIHNDDNADHIIKHGDAIARVVFLKKFDDNIEIVTADGSTIDEIEGPVAVQEPEKEKINKFKKWVVEPVANDQ